MAKKKSTKNLSNGKRRKRMSERRKDSKDRDEAYADLYKACTNFFDGAMQEEFMYSEVGPMYFDQMRRKYDLAEWVTRRVNQNYVSKSIDDETTSIWFYTQSP